MRLKKLSFITFKWFNGRSMIMSVWLVLSKDLSCKLGISAGKYLPTWVKVIKVLLGINLSMYF